jgi:nucleoporin GLE1
MSSNMQTAFGMAAVLITLWQKYQDLGKLFLYYLYKECPYMVPYFLPQLEGQSDEDYMKSLGFRFKDGVVENREQYLKHIAGTTRLYAAVLVTRPRVGVQAPHPHSLENGWRWLTDVLNLDPQPDVCATILTEFLQVAGYHLWQAYGRQFSKLMVLMQTQYMPRLARVDQGGPKSRLEKLLADIVRNGKIDPPEGLLSPNFW